MDAPLTLPGALEELGQQPAAEPQRLPQDLRDDVRRGLSPFVRLGQWTPAAISALWGCTLLVTGSGAMKKAGAQAAANAVLISGIGTVPTLFGQVNRAAAVVVPHALAQLDEARVSAKVMGTLRKRIKGAKVLLAWNVSIISFVSVVVVIESEPVDPYEWVAAVVVVAAAPVVIVFYTVVLFAPELVYILAADMADQVAAEVSCVTAATADYNGLAQRVYRVHRETVALSEKMTPAIAVQAFGLLLTTLLFLFVAVDPQRPPATGEKWFGMGNWYNFFFNQYLMAFVATVSAAQLVWGLAGPAKVTSACQRIASAVNDLRVTSATAAGDTGTVTLATAEQGHQIEILNRYINELRTRVWASSCSGSGLHSRS